MQHDFLHTGAHKRLLFRVGQSVPACADCLERLPRLVPFVLLLCLLRLPQRLLCAFTGRALARDCVTQGIVLGLSKQAVQPTQAAACPFERTAALLCFDLAAGRRRGLRGQPRQVAHNDLLDLTRHHAPVRAIFVMHQMWLGLVARIADQLIPGPAPLLITHLGAAVPTDQQAGQQFVPYVRTRLVRPQQAALHAQECVPVDQRLMPSGVALALVDDHTRVAFAQQDLPHQMLIRQPKFTRDTPGRLTGKKTRVHLSYSRCIRIGHQNSLCRIVVIAERCFAAARPKTLLDALDHTHTCTQKDVFAFQLRKRRQNADHRAAIRAARVDILIDGHEIHAMRQEHILNEVKRILLAAAQTVKLIDHNALDRPAADRLNQLGDRRARQVGAGKPAVDIALKRGQPLHAAVSLELLRLCGQRIAFVGLRFGRYTQV